MPTSVGPNLLSENSLVFNYDTGDIVNSYKGAPTTNNYGNNFRDFTGTSYGYGTEWTSNPTQFTKTYDANFATPIGPGATLIQESGNNGYHHLSTYGGGDESGANTISCYLYPISNDIIDFTIGMLADSNNTIRFNLVTRQITYGAGISNRNAIIQDVPGWPGWLRVGANIEGRPGGWVGCLGYSVYTIYTGTAGAKKCYITGIQYEYQTYVTPFVGGTRSVSASLIDISGYRKTVNSMSASYDSIGGLFFSGSNYLIADPSTRLTTHTIESIFKPTAHPNNKSCIASDQYSTFVNYKLGYESVASMAGGFYDGTWRLTPNIATTLNVWQHVVYTYDGSTLSIYKNGILGGTTLYTGSPNTNGLSLRIGRRWDNPEYFVGDIPIVRIYNRALTPDEITNNFNKLKTRFNIS